MPIKTVIFDFGNVVAFFDHSRAVARLAGYTEFPPVEVALKLYGSHIEDAYEPDTGQSDIYDSPAPRTATVSRIGERRSRRDEIDDIFADEEPAA